jgi:uncharacterized protein
METKLDLPDQVLSAIRLNNEGHFFEAHEAFEFAWRAAESPLREFYQALLWVSVMNYHLERGNLKGAERMGIESVISLSAYATAPLNIDLQALVDSLRRTSKMITKCSAEESSSQIHIPTVMIPLKR